MLDRQIAIGGGVQAAPRFVEVRGDMMEPDLRRGDFVLLAPVSRYLGEGYYAVLIGPDRDDYGLYGCCVSGSRKVPKIRLYCLNKHYGDQFLRIDEFNECVVGKIAMFCKVKDRSLLPQI